MTQETVLLAWAGQADYINSACWQRCWCLLDHVPDNKWNYMQT